MANRIKWCVVGIGDHQGVANVGGRLGAAAGPKEFRLAFNRLKGRDGVHDSLASDLDAGPFGPDVSSNHRTAADLIAESHRKYGLSVVVGGGHDHGFSHIMGVREALSPSPQGKTSVPARIGCINLDAHLDVRKPEPLISSGSPFYLAIESGVLDSSLLVEFGIQRHCNASELWSYVEKKGVQVVPFEQLRYGQAAQAFKGTLGALAARCDHVVISLDLDAAAEVHAPGVSAPQAEGFSATDVIEMMEMAGSHPKVASLGIFELNPEHDADHRTARLAATAAYHFIASRLVIASRLGRK